MKLTPQIIADIRDKLDIPEVQWKILLSNAGGEAFDLVKEIVSQGWGERDVVGMALGNSMSKAYLKLETTLFQQEVVDLLPCAVAKKLEAIPVYQFGNAVTVAMTDPVNEDKVQQLRSVIGRPIDCLFSFKDEVDAAISVYYQTKNEIDEFIAHIDVAGLERLSESKQIESQDIVTLSNSLIYFALKERASDIHLHPRKNNLLVRLRVDGVLKDYLRINNKVATTLLSRFKITSQMDITEKRKPQDGRMLFETAVKNIDIRVSALPALYGEKLVLRLLGSIKESVPLNLDKLDISHEVLIPFKKVLKQPNGLVLVTGPTGSGKTTTLYAALNFMNSPDLNIITIEDPVEYEIASFTQVAVNDKVGRTFASVLRSSLRQDPDVILVGETRDAETGNVATQAALTGHLVLTTLHTNNALQAVTRLLEMQIEPYVLAPSLHGVLAQRLVRRLCDQCKTAYTPELDYMRQYFHWKSTTNLPQLFHAEGCNHCGGTGFKGRVGIHEFLKIDSKLRTLIARNAPYDELQSHVASKRLPDLRYDGFKKALQGITTIEEVIQVAGMDT